jgi:PAS domain S-box-containing protein
MHLKGRAPRSMLNTVALSAETLAAALEQSVDCVKLVGIDGTIRWMNFNGQCAMDIDDFSAVSGRQWCDLWPAETQAAIIAAIADATNDKVVRFDAFCPTAKGAPRWWNVTVSKVRGPDSEHAGFLAISRDITETEANRQAMLVAAAELRHRLKNTYAMIGSLMLGFARGAPDRELFAEEMAARLLALSSAQSLFSTNNAPREIGDLIPALVSPFNSPTCLVTVDVSSRLIVSQGQADAIALVLGELAVNSSKHGAIASSGNIAVTAKSDGEWATIVWTEEGRDAVAAHTRQGGQGLTLIGRIVRARKGELDIDWQERGLTVTLKFRVESCASSD